MCGTSIKSQILIVFNNDAKVDDIMSIELTIKRPIIIYHCRTRSISTSALRSFSQTWCLEQDFLGARQNSLVISNTLVTNGHPQT